MYICLDWPLVISRDGYKQGRKYVIATKTDKNSKVSILFMKISHFQTKLGWNKSNRSSPVQRLDVQVTGVSATWSKSAGIVQFSPFNTDTSSLFSFSSCLMTNTFYIILFGSKIEWVSICRLSFPFSNGSPLVCRDPKRKMLVYLAKYPNLTNSSTTLSCIYATFYVTFI